MFKEKAILIFYAETSIHMGAGQSVSYVDLPIQRERHTSFPILWSSGIKGVIREVADRKWEDKEKVNIIFGPEDGSEQYASCISITDAKILLYPVRSVKGIFAWITCPLVLKRFKEDLESIEVSFPYEIPELKRNNEEEVIISDDSVLKIDQGEVGLEEFLFDIKKEENAKAIAEFIKKCVPQNSLTNSLSQHIAIVHDDVFKDFVNYAVEIRTRIKIDQTTGTVQGEALFNEEIVPSESVFYSLLFISDPYFGVKREIYCNLRKLKVNNKEATFQEVYDSLSEEEKKEIDKRKEIIEKAYNEKFFTAGETKTSLGFLDNHLIQLGGDETTGKGFMRVKFCDLTHKED